MGMLSGMLAQRGEQGDSLSSGERFHSAGVSGNSGRRIKEGKCPWDHERRAGGVVLWFYFTFTVCTDHPAWTSEGDYIGWDVFCNDAAGTNDGIAADGDTRQQDGSSSNPYVVSDDHRGSLCFAEFKGAVFQGRSKK